MGCFISYKTLLYAVWYMMKQEIPELSLRIVHWFLRVWEFGACGSSLTRNVKPANPANCHGKVREVKKIILHCRLWLIFWHWENNFCQQKENLQSMVWETENQIDRVALTAVPGPILHSLSRNRSEGTQTFSWRPQLLYKLQQDLICKISFGSRKATGWQRLILSKDKCATFQWL